MQVREATKTPLLLGFAKLEVCNVPKYVSEVEVRLLFEKCGKVVETHMLMDNADMTKFTGRAYVRYATAKEASQAIQELDGTMPMFDELEQLQATTATVNSSHSGLGSGPGATTSATAAAATAGATNATVAATDATAATTTTATTY